VVEVPDVAVIPRRAKWAAALWLAVWLPLHLAAHPPSSFLWWCAHGAVLTVIGLLLESRILISWQAVALIVPQAMFVAEALARAITGARGGGTSYLFDPAIPFAVRALSSFHFAMPIVLVWAVRRLGYDRRGLLLAVVLGTLLNLGTMTMDPVNLWVWPWGREHPIAALVLAPFALWLPVDRILRRRPSARPSTAPDRQR
jgi:hypothetical protein